MISIHFHFLFLKKQKMSWYHNYFKMTEVLGFEMVRRLKVPENLNFISGTHNAKGECVLSEITGMNMNSSPYLPIQHRKGSTTVTYVLRFSITQNLSQVWYFIYYYCSFQILYMFLMVGLLLMSNIYLWKKKRFLLLEQT